MELGQRSISSILWNSFSTISVTIVLFLRSIFLARLLPVDVFGVYALGISIIGITGVVLTFGLEGAFIHRTQETNNEQKAVSVYFTLILFFSLPWLFFMILGANLFSEERLRIVLISLAIIFSLTQLAQTPRILLLRRINHKRIAIFLIIEALSTSVVSVGLAWFGITLWSLLATDIVSFLLSIIIFMIYKPIWKIKLDFSPLIIRYFLNFGSKNLLGQIIMKLLEKLDDVWTGFFHGELSLGYYSRAYGFATYPSKLVANPIQSVSLGTYAELKDNRLKLSQVFFQMNAILIRSGFFLGGIMFIVAPELIPLIIGDKWLPMVFTFQLLLVFTLLNPIKLTIGYLFVAVGKPNILVRIRLIQLLIMMIGLLIFGNIWNIEGVALAVNIMLLIGIFLLLNKAKTYVDFSIQKLFWVPLNALVMGLLASLIISQIMFINDWKMIIIKGFIFSCAFISIMFWFERNQVRDMFLYLINLYGIDSPFAKNIKNRIDRGR